MVNIDQAWEEAKRQLRAEWDRLWKENAELRKALELSQGETREAARKASIYLDRCPRCGYTEVEA